MKSTRPGLASALVLAWLAVPCLLAQNEGPGAPEDADRAIHDLKIDISILNLLNGIHLTRDQSLEVVRLARKAGELRADYFAEESDAIDEIRTAFTDLREILRKGESIPDDLRHQAETMDHRIRELIRAYHERVNAIEAELAAVLDPAQRAVLADFKECVIPPKELADPVRVGQAHEAQELEGMIEFLVALPDATVRKVAERHLLEIEHLLGKMEDAEREAYLGRILDVVREARALPAHERPLRLPELAKRLNPFADLERKFVDFEQTVHRIQGGPGKIGKFLLHPRIVPILEDRLAHPEFFETRGKTDLGSIDGAPSCGKEPGDCGKAGGESARAEPPKAKPTVREVGRAIGLDDQGTERLRRTIRQRQEEVFRLISIRPGDGTDIPTEIGKIESSGASPEERGRRFVELLSRPIPEQGEETYLGRIFEIGLALDEEVCAVLSEDEYARFKALKVEYLDIQTD